MRRRHVTSGRICAAAPATQRSSTLWRCSRPASLRRRCWRRGWAPRGARYEGTDLALGDRGYVDDIRLPGLLRGGVRLADHARADVLEIDTTAARAVPGVEAVFTAADVPAGRMSHSSWPVLTPEGGRTSYLGDVLAIVVADSKQTAREAAKLVEVSYRRFSR